LSYRRSARLQREAAESLNYRVDAAGSSLRTGLTHTVGVIIPLAHAAKQNLSDPFFLEILEFPMVVWGTRMKGQSYITIGSDNEAGAKAATSHLISQGCRKIVFLGDPAAPEVGARLEGYRQALRDVGIATSPQLEVAVRFGSDTAYHATASLIDAEVAFDGIVACSDVFAMSAMRALIERGRKVPADVAIVGFDDIPFAAYTTPPLTTIRQNCQTGARLLVEKLIRAIRHEPNESVVIPTELVVRASSLREHYRALPTIPTARDNATPRSRKAKTG
jgi:DNA-binding LacI/PurR family transcriptional regulator